MIKPYLTFLLTKNTFNYLNDKLIDFDSQTSINLTHSFPYKKQMNSLGELNGSFKHTEPNINLIEGLKLKGKKHLIHLLLQLVYL
jgi:hypothetical protein